MNSKIAVACVALYGLASCKSSTEVIDARVAPLEASASGRQCADGGSLTWQGVDAGSAIAIDQRNIGVNLFDIWGVAPNTLYAVGAGGRVLHYNGTTWQRLTVPTTQNLNSIWGTSPTDIWVAGDGGVVLHYNGRAWVDRSPPVGALFDADGGVPVTDAGASIKPTLWGIWAGLRGSATEVYAVGDNGTVAYFAGGVWQRVVTTVTEKLSDVWGVDPDKMFIVGDFGTVLAGGKTLGKAQTGVSKPLAAVWGRAVNDVYAAGLAGTLLHFNGSRWRSIEGMPNQYLRAIWGPADDNTVVYAAGWDGTLVGIRGGPGFGDGATTVPYFCVTSQRLEGIWGNGASLWAVGVDGTIYTATSSSVPAVPTVSGDDGGASLP